MIENKIHNRLNEYTSKEVTVDKKLFNDLKIYGDDIEELIHELSKELNFDEIEFWNNFASHGFYNPPEIYLNLPKVFYLDLKELLFHFRLEYKDSIKTGKDISVKELMELIQRTSEIK